MAAILRGCSSPWLLFSMAVLFRNCSSPWLLFSMVDIFVGQLVFSTIAETAGNHRETRDGSLSPSESTGAIMKKIFFLFSILMCLFLSAACGAADKQTNPASGTDPAAGGSSNGQAQAIAGSASGPGKTERGKKGKGTESHRPVFPVL